MLFIIIEEWQYETAAMLWFIDIHDCEGESRGFSRAQACKAWKEVDAKKSRILYRQNE